MQTVGHVIINVALLGSFLGPVEAVALGAALPDLPILVLYVSRRLIHRTPEDEIWSVHYQKPGWLGVIHGAHSFPFALAGMALSAAVGTPVGVAFFASMVCHALGDLPVHAIDAHRHFFPLSNYRYISRYSYWDPRFGARQVVLGEAALVLASSAWIVARGCPPWAVVVLVFANIGYVLHCVRFRLAPVQTA